MAWARALRDLRCTGTRCEGGLIRRGDAVRMVAEGLHPWCAICARVNLGEAPPADLPELEAPVFSAPPPRPTFEKQPSLFTGQTVAEHLRARLLEQDHRRRASGDRNDE
jgi:hypothetical protein